MASWFTVPLACALSLLLLHTVKGEISSSECDSDDAALTQQTKDELERFPHNSVTKEDLNQVFQLGAVGVHIYDQQVYFTNTEGIMPNKLLLFHDLLTSVLDMSWQGPTCESVPNVSLAVRFTPSSKAELDSLTDSDNDATAAETAAKVARAWAQRRVEVGTTPPNVPTFCFSRRKKGSNCILVPGPHYGDLQSWSKYTAKWQIAGRHNKYIRRKSTAIWRGGCSHNCDYSRPRIELAIQSVNSPQELDIGFTKGCHKAQEWWKTQQPDKCSWVNDQVQDTLEQLKKQKPVLRWQLCAWKYILSLPEKFSGHWSSDWADRAWGCGSVVLVWHELTAYEEWYHADVEAGRDFLYVHPDEQSHPGSEGVVSVVRALREDPARAEALAVRAQNISNEVLAADRIARYWRATLLRYAAIQGFHSELPSEACTCAEGPKEERQQCAFCAGTRKWDTGGVLEEMDLQLGGLRVGKTSFLGEGLWMMAGAAILILLVLTWVCLAYGCPALTKYGYMAKPLPD